MSTNDDFIFSTFSISPQYYVKCTNICYKLILVLETFTLSPKAKSTDCNYRNMFFNPFENYIIIDITETYVAAILVSIIKFILRAIIF